MKNPGRLRMICLVLSLSLLLSTSSFATADMTIEEAKNYLLNYEVEGINNLGKTYSYSYVFHNEEALNAAAAYVAENGADAYHAAFMEAVRNTCSREQTTTVMQPRYTSPSSGYVQISDDGPNPVEVSIEAVYGIAQFDTFADTEYSLDLSYSVEMYNGAITGIDEISCIIDVSGYNGGYSDLSFQTYVTDTECGVTASYRIYRHITPDMVEDMEDFPYQDMSIMYQSDAEYFALHTTLVN